MTDQEINEAIALKCGWRIVRQRGCATQVLKPDGTFAGLLFKPSSDPLPNYCADLNAMHEAEGMIPWPCWLDYMGHLNVIVSSEPEGMGRMLWHATHRQRAEAFLRTFGLWKE